MGLRDLTGHIGGYQICPHVRLAMNLILIRTTWLQIHKSFRAERAIWENQKNSCISQIRNFRNREGDLPRDPIEI